MNFGKMLTLAGLSGLLFLQDTPSASAIGINIYYRDAAGIGFNDPVHGAARRTALEHAMQIAADTINGNIPLSVDAYFATGLGVQWGYDEGYPTQFWREITNGLPGVYYPVSLANQLAGYDHDAGQSDMVLTFNADLDVFGGTYGERFYYGLDGYAGDDVDFVTIALHAFCRGVGFYTLLDPASGEYHRLGSDTSGYPDILTVNLVHSKKPVWNKKSKLLITLPAKKRKKALKSINALRWAGWSLTNAAGYMVPMYAPKVKKKNPVPYGVADHFDPSFGAGEVLWPYYTWAPVHSLAAARFAMIDMGWTLY